MPFSPNSSLCSKNYPRIINYMRNYSGSRFRGSGFPAASGIKLIKEVLDSKTNDEFIQFLRYAKRLCTEVHSELYIALEI